MQEMIPLPFWPLGAAMRGLPFGAAPIAARDHVGDVRRDEVRRRPWFVSRIQKPSLSNSDALVRGTSAG